MHIATTANYVSSTLQEQVSILTNQFNRINAALRMGPKYEDDIEYYMQTRMIVPLAFFHDIYYIDTDNENTYSLLGRNISKKKQSAIINLFETKQSAKLFSLDIQDLNPLTYTYITAIENTSAKIRLLCYDINLYELNEYINTLNYSKFNSVVVSDNNNNIVLSDVNLTNQAYSEIKNDLISYFNSEETTKVITSASNQTYYAYSVNINSMGWKLTVFSKIGDIATETESVVFYIIGFIILFLIIQFIATTIEWSIITKAFNEIIVHIQNIRNNIFGSKVSKVYAREFVPIVEAFNDMSEDLHNTINQKLKAERTRQYYEYRALIAQVNPHFLYNTLNSINALLDLKRYGDIRSINTALISMLSYSLAKNGQAVRIGEEIELVTKYVDMQKIRYNNRFSLKVSLNEEIMSKTILHMSIMPLVENAIFHGFPYKDTKNGIIDISGYIAKDGESICLIIRDNGIGISDQKIKEIMKDNSIDVDIKDLYQTKNRYVSIGIKNVHDRLKLYYGDKYGLRLESEPDKRTEVTVLIPNRDF